MPTVIQKYSWDWFVAHASPELVVLVVVAILVSFVTYKVLAIHSVSKKEREENQITHKQQRKSEKLIGNCPCISKKNSNWLLDHNASGEPPDDKIHCAFLEAKERGEV